MTSLALDLANIYLPDTVKKRELNKIASATYIVLTKLLEEASPGNTKTLDLQPLAGSIDLRRAAMARNHRLLIEALAEEIGASKAEELSREALFKVGISLGKEARTQFGVKNNPRDLLKAAKVLYSILGIKFTTQESAGVYFLEINTCELSKFYTEQTCNALSVVDEGVVKGLNPSANMQFTQKITSGCKSCIVKATFVADYL